MKKTTRILAVVLSVVMALSVLPFVAFAEEPSENEVRVAGWKANYELFIDTVLDNANYTSWQYVDQNKKVIDQQLTTYTAFALYDSAWKNYATQEVSIEDAEQILLAMIEKAEYDFDDGYVDEIMKVLETATDVNDFIQKVNDIANIEAISNVVESSGWSTAFDVINTAIKVGNAYQTYRDKFIEAYANVLSIQMANAYYIDMLQYVVDNSEYDVLKTAAANLIADINASVEDVLQQIVAEAGGDTASVGVDYLIKIALNSNAYTAVALKVYDGAKSVADFLWNTGDTYKYIDTVKTAYYFQQDAAAWAKLALDGADADKAVIAFDLMITARKVCEDVLYNLKLAENGGVVGKVKSKLYGTVCEDIEINVAALDIIRGAMFDKEVADFRKVVRALNIYCPVDILVTTTDNVAVYTLVDGAAVNTENESGIYASVYSEYSEDYLKIAYLYDNYRIKLVGTADGTVTLLMDVLNADATVDDWSFTDVKVAKGNAIVFDTAFTGTPFYTFSNAAGFDKIDFNDVFVPSEHPEVTAQEVIDATVEVGKDEAKSFLKQIKAFFAKLFSFFTNLFNR